MYCICVLNIKVKKGFLSTSFRKHHTTYKRVLSKPEKGHNKKDDKSRNERLFVCLTIESL